MKTIIFTLLLVCILSSLVLGSDSKYEKDGDFIIGAILPITKRSGTVVNPLGVALTEAIVQAVKDVEKDQNNKFTTLLSTTTFGYSIQDSQSDSINEREIAYDFSKVALDFSKNKSSPNRPVNVVISSFQRNSVKVLNILNIENIPQISYSENNVKLLQDSTIEDKTIQNLISAYPENTMKIKALVDIIGQFDFQYVYAVFSPDYQSIKAKKLLGQQLKKRSRCETSFIINDASDIDKIITEFKKNELIKVLVIHCHKELELELYSALGDENLTRFLILTTQDWSKNEEELKSYSPLVNGMIYLQQERDLQTFNSNLKALKSPYDSRNWVERLYKSLGGDKNAEEKVKIELLNVASQAIYAYDAVYTIANALLKGRDIVSAVKGLTFEIGTLPYNGIIYTDDMTTEANQFRIQNMQSNKTQSTLVGTWKKQPFRRDLTLFISASRASNTKIDWGTASDETPESTCSKTCELGFKRTFLNLDSKCCWTCERCPNGTFSNVTNSDQCYTCGIGCVAKPDQTGFVYYNLEQFDWFSSSGSLIIFLIVVGCVLVIFALVVVSTNSHHELIELSGYLLLCFFLIGILLLCIAPIPLLSTPSQRSCTAYITIFNFGLTIVFSVLITRSSLVNSFYDNYTGKVVKDGLGKSPRLTIVVLLMLTQLIILCVGLAIDRPKTLHNDTDQWDVKWWECSSWASYGFWAAFSYNLALSILGNFLSCTSTNLVDLCSELKWILLTYLIFYINGIIEIIIFYRISDEALAIGQAIICIVMAMCFYFLFIWPKMFYILFRAQRDANNKFLRRRRLDVDEEHSYLTTAIRSSDGFKHGGVVQMKIKEEENSG